MTQHRGDPTSEPTPPPARRGGPLAPDDPPRVLLVDDRQENLDVLAAVLEPLGAELVLARSAPEALRQLLGGDVAVIVLDVQMPGIDGFETARLIRARERSRATPIILATALDRDRRHDLAGHQAGAVDVLYKPLDPDVLRAKVATFLELHRLRSHSALADRLRDSERRAAAAVEAALDCVVSIDHEGRITEFNPAAERTFGYRRSDVLGRAMAELIIPPEYRGAHDRGMARYQATGEAHVLGRRLELPAMRADGSVFPAELTILRMPVAGPPSYTAFLRDITELRRARDRTRRHQEVTAALARALTPEEVAAVVVEQGVAALGAAAGSIYRMTDDGAHGRALELLGAEGYPEGMLARWRRVDLDATIPLADAVRTAAPIFIESADAWNARYSGTGPLRTLPGSGAWAAVPLVVDDRVLGAMGLSFDGNAEAHVLDAESQAFILALAQQCAQAFERARLHAGERAARVQAEDARAQAEGASQAKSHFLATMSHELRTPLNAITGYAQLLDLGIAGPLTAEQRTYLDRLRASSMHLLALVEDVLDLSRVEAGEMSVARGRATTGAVVVAALELVAPQAAARGVALVDDGPRGSGVPYVGDAHRARQIVVNLLSNAVKFTEPGGTVSVRCALVAHAAPAARVRGEGPWATIRVADTGIGIPAEHHERVFAPFHQVEAGHTRRAGGTGLGLAISRRIAVLMGGDLTLESTPGVGSTFTLWLPSPGEAATGGPEDDDVRAARAASAPVAPGTEGLAGIGLALRAEVDEIVRAYAARLRADPLTPLAKGLRPPELEDHAVTLLSDIAQSLVILDDAGERRPELLQDAAAIQRTIAERHGRRRLRQGWSEHAVRRDYAVLAEEAGRAVRTRDVGAPEDAHEALAVLDRLVERAMETSLVAFREAERRAAT